MLQLFNSKYQYLQNLAQGSISNMVLVRDLSKNRLCTLKIILKELLEDPMIAQNMKREILIHRNLNHKNIVKLYETFEDDSYLYLALEYCNGGSLQQGVYGEEAIFKLFHDVLDAMDYLHGINIIYRDLKPDNIYIDNGTFKLCDFGCAIQLSDQIVKHPFTVNEYCAPEILLGEYDSKVDVWSLGIIAYELLHGYKPQMEVQVNEKLDEDLQILLYAMLTRPVQQRPTCKQIYLCKWFKKMMKQHKLYNKYEHEQLKTKVINKQVQIKTLNNCCFDIKQAALSDALSDATTAPMIPNSIQNSADSLHDSVPIVENPANPQM